MKRILALAGLSVCIVLMSAPARSQPSQPVREGFTLELGLGLAWMQFDDVSYFESFGSGGFSSGEIRERRSRFGLTPLSLSLGGFLSSDFALAGRLGGTSYFGGDTQFCNCFYGVVGQYWLDDRFFVGGGPGLAVFGPNAFFGGTDVDPVGGFGLNGRLGAMFWNGTGHGLGAVLELFPSWYEDQTVVGAALNLEWQLY